MAFTACDDDQSQPNGYIANTTEGSKTIVLKGFTGYQDGYNTLIADPFTRPLYISRTEGAAPQFAGAYYDFYTTTSASLEDMKLPSTEDATVWQTNADIIPGKCYWASYYDKEVFRFMKIRVAYIEGNNVGVEYIVVSDTQERPNENKNANSDIDDEAAQLLEIPRVNTTNYFAAHYVDYDKLHIMNLAIEWNAAMRHSSWVAFSFDSTTSQDNVKRGDGWKWDPVIPAELGEVTEDDHKSDGYDKGHLCASEDRVYCKEANDQTFFYSNISPQIGSFNQKYWAKLEALIQKWGRSTQQGVFDKVYVAKGGTINKLIRTGPASRKPTMDCTLQPMQTARQILSRKRVSWCHNIITWQSSRRRTANSRLSASMCHTLRTSLQSLQQRICRNTPAASTISKSRQVLTSSVISWTTSRMKWKLHSVLRIGSGKEC